MVPGIGHVKYKSLCNGPGTLYDIAGNLSSVNPDENGDIRIARIEVQCLTGTVMELITFKTIQGFDSVVGH